MHILFEFTVGKLRQLNSLLVFTTIILSSFFLYQGQLKKQDQSGILIIIAWLATGVIGLSFYQHSVFDHYIAYLFPATFLLYGFIFDRIIKVHKLGIMCLIGFALGFLQYNFSLYNFQPSGPTLDQLKEAANSIHSRVKPGEKYAMILLSSSKDLYGMNYRYFLHTDLSKLPVFPENHGLATKLIIVDEERVAADPLALPIYEIITFGDKQVTEEYQLPSGTEVIILEKRGQSSERDV